MTRQRWMTRTAVSVVLVAALAIWLDTSGTLSGFTVAKTGNPASARLAGLSFLNSQGACSGSTTSASPVPCASTVLPATVTATAASQTNTVTNTGDVAPSAISARYRVAGCGAVSLANQKSGTTTGTGGTANGAGTSGVLLPRSGATFSTAGGPMTSSGYLTLASNGYAASNGSTTEPVASLGTVSYGLGVWFRTTDSGVDPLLGFGSNPRAVVDASANNDRILYLSGGKIGFIINKSGTATPLGTASGVTSYSDGAWHYAYVMFGNGLLGLTGNMAAVFVDGRQVGTNTTGWLYSVPYSGYWHLGWSPIASASSYFNGALSGFTVDDSGNAPTSSTSPPTSYTSFDTTATQLWQLDDSGGSFAGSTVGGIYTGGVFPAGADPCTYVDMTWTMTNPAQTVSTSNATLRSMVTTGYLTGTAPAVGTPQLSTIGLTRNSSYNAYASGLILYAPIQTTYTLTSTAAWTVSFTWNAAAPTSSTVLG